MKNQFNQFPRALLWILFMACTTLFSQENEVFYASAGESNILVLEPSFSSSKSNKSFVKKYHFLVARAYFKLLAEAQKSERKLRQEYERYSFENEKFDRAGNQTFQKKLNLAYTKYKAHSAMLSGLKSWNLFSEDRTGDMVYFMAENENRIFQMYKGIFPAP